jgi:hypothetical protein
MKPLHISRMKKKQKRPAAVKISTARARRIAARHVMARMFDGVRVEDGEEYRWHAYNVRRKNVWLVFPKIDQEPVPMVFRSSHVIVICRRTGRVLYEGSANDEG